MNDSGDSFSRECGCERFENLLEDEKQLSLDRLVDYRIFFINI